MNPVQDPIHSYACNPDYIPLLSLNFGKEQSQHACEYLRIVEKALSLVLGSIHFVSRTRLCCGAG